jgi:RNA polymerase sigma-70 factor (ECF subfamily)
MINNPDVDMIHKMPAVKDETLSTDILTQIYLQYSKPVYNFMRYRINDRHEAEELTSGVFEKVIAKYYMFNNQKGNFDVWIFSIAKNTLNDYFRFQRNRKIYSVETTDEIPADVNETDPQNMIVANEEATAIIKSLSVLNEKEKTIISLKYGGGLRNKDIAKILGLSEKNIGVILCRSIKKLRENLEKNYN